MADKQIPVFPFDKIAKVEISGGFYTRLSQLVVSYTQQHDLKDVVSFLEEMKTREPKTEYEYHMMTLLTLIASIEKAAEEQKLIELRDLPPHNTEGSNPGN